MSLISPCLNPKEKLECLLYIQVNFFIVYAQHSGVASVPSTTALQCSCSAWLIILGWKKTKHLVYIFWRALHPPCILLLRQYIQIWKDHAATSCHPLACLYWKHSSFWILFGYVKKWTSIMPKCISLGHLISRFGIFMKWVHMNTSMSIHF